MLHSHNVSILQFCRLHCRVDSEEDNQHILPSRISCIHFHISCTLHSRLSSIHNHKQHIPNHSKWYNALYHNVSLSVQMDTNIPCIGELNLQFCILRLCCEGIHWWWKSNSSCITCNLHQLSNQHNSWHLVSIFHSNFWILPIYGWSTIATFLAFLVVQDETPWMSHYTNMR